MIDINSWSEKSVGSIQIDKFYQALYVLTLTLLAALSLTKIRKDSKKLEVPECEVGG